MTEARVDPALAHLKEHAWEEVSAINQALADGRLDEADGTTRWPRW